MANRQALRELQTRLAERLQAARSETRTPGWLAVESGGLGFLLPLAQAGEIFAMTVVQPVRRTRPWFAGVANLRGNLVGVVDLAAFLGLHAEAPAQAGRGGQLVALNPSLGLACALWVDRLAGLRAADQLKLSVSPSISMPKFARERWLDADGRQWMQLDLAALAADPTFLSVAS
jgi:twitching motility protein PilI